LVDWLFKRCTDGGDRESGDPSPQSKLREADETAGGDDGEPEEERKSAGEFGAEWQDAAIVPCGELAVGGELEDEGLNAGERDEQQLQTKGGIVVEFDGFRREQQRTGDELHRERGPGPEEKAGCKIGDAFTAEGPAEQTQIESADGGNQYGHAEKMDGFNHGEQPERFADARGETGLLEPFAQGERVDGGYGAPRSERPSGRMIMPRDM